MSDLFGDNQSTTELSDNLDDWIGEGKKYATPEDALKSVPHAQKHIKQLEQSYEQLREEFNKAQTAAEQATKLDEIAELLKQGQAKATPGHNPEESKGITPEALEELIQSRVPEYLERTLSERQKADNVMSVNNELVQRFGDDSKARQALEAKAKELGVSLADMKEMAAKSPKAVLAYFPASNPEPNKGFDTRVNAEAMSTQSSAKTGTWGFYEQLRKNHPKEYFKPAVQLQMMKDRESKGADFWK